jgi:hypothetical protein
MQPPKKPDLLFKNREELDRAIRHVSRRNFIEGSLSAAILAAAAAFYPPDVAAQARYRLRRKPAPPVGGGRTALTAADIQFNGFHRFPDAGSGDGTMNNSGDAIMAVTYSPERGTWFTIGSSTTPSGSTLYEMSLPSETPSMDPDAGPILTKVANWGQYILGDLVGDGLNSPAVAHIHWDSTSEGIYTWYNVGYTLGNQQTLVWTSLNGTAAQRTSDPVTYVATTRGGWRNNYSAWSMWGGPLILPQDWADLHTDGAPFAFSGSRSKSGVGHSYGPSLVTTDLHTFDPSTAAADAGGDNTVVGTNYSITSTRPIWLNGKTGGETIPTNTTTKICGQALGEPDYPKYTCAYDPWQNPLRTAEQIFGTDEQAVGETDSIMFALFFDNGEKWGVINFASLADTPAGYMSTIVANDWDDDGIVHRGYANYLHKAVDENGVLTSWNESTCCHGQVDSTWQSTGPWATCREKFLYLYSPDTYAGSIATGNVASLKDRFPDETINLRTLMEAAMGAVIPYVGNGGFCPGFGGAFQYGNKIYVTMKRFENSRNSSGAETGTRVPRAVLAEFEII